MSFQEKKTEKHKGPAVPFTFHAFRPKAVNEVHWQVFWLNPCLTPSRYLQWHFVKHCTSVQSFTATGIAHDLHMIPF
jgi:hypothetical protein